MPCRVCSRCHTNTMLVCVGTIADTGNKTKMALLNLSSVLKSIGEKHIACQVKLSVHTSNPNLVSCNVSACDMITRYISTHRLGHSGVCEWHQICECLCARHFTYVSPLSGRSNLWGWCFCYHDFIGREAEATKWSSNLPKAIKPTHD